MPKDSAFLCVFIAYLYFFFWKVFSLFAHLLIELLVVLVTLFYGVLKMETRTRQMLGKGSAIELQPQPWTKLW
jgi:hypothetical protein